MKLNKYDYELLDFLQNNKNCSLNKILEKFPNDKYGTKYRLFLLSFTAIDKKYTEYISLIKEMFPEFLHPHKVISYISCKNGTYNLTSRGYKVLIDYKAEKRKNFLKHLDSFIFKILPLIISFLSVYCSYLAITRT